MKATVGEARVFVTERLMQLPTLFRGNPQAARATLMKHIKQLVLIPGNGPSGPVFEVSGPLS